MNGPRLCTLAAILMSAVRWSGNASRLRAQEAPTFIPYTVAPKLLNRAEVKRAVRSLYPAELRAWRVYGRVWVRFLVPVDGSSRDPTVVQGSGYPAMDSAALRVAMRMRWKPGLRYRETVPVHVLLPIVFEPDESEGH